ncbi:hypothetical protein ACFSE1_10755 [Rhizobium helianthi]|uniref:Intersectin-EH binding protein Ibp1 n=1 Tax=Rhizobium helianthi TaxID=1132695 RepID=A0ABW4M3A8_9HYPH
MSEFRTNSGTNSGRFGLRILSLTLALGALLAATEAVAQAGTTAPSPSTDRCLTPDGQSGGSSGQAPDSKPESLSGNLANCNGVLKPPVTGDHELVEPAPQTGNMPVIKPGEAPQNPSGG